MKKQTSKYMYKHLQQRGTWSLSEGAEGHKAFMGLSWAGSQACISLHGTRKLEQELQESTSKWQEHANPKHTH